MFDILDHYEDEIGVPSYISALLNASSSEYSSIDDIASNMIVSASTLMRPAQVKSGVGYVNEMPQSPPKSPLSYTVLLQWSNQYYTKSNWDVASAVNMAQGIRVYQSDGSGGWALIATVSPSATSYTYDADPSEVFTYKITAFNSSGNSLNPVVINCSVVSKITTDGGDNRGMGLSLTGIRPNPFSNHIVIGLESSENRVLLYNILDAAGRIAQHGELPVYVGRESEYVVPTSGLGAGSYILQLLTTEGALIGQSRVVKLN